MDAIKKNLNLLVLTPLFSLLLPFTHGGGPYNTNSFKTLFVWVITLLFGSFVIVRSGQFCVPKFLKYSLPLIIGLSALILGHGQGYEISDWIPVGLIFVFAIAVVVYSNWFSQFNPTEWDKFLSSLGSTVLVTAGLLVLLTLPGGRYLSLVEPVAILGMPFPLTQGSFNQPNEFSSFLVMCLGFSIWTKFRVGNNSFRASELVCAPLILGLVFASGSRVGAISIIFVMFVWAFALSARKNYSAVIWLSLIGVSGWFLGWVVNQVGASVSGSGAVTALDGLASVTSSSDGAVAARIGMLKAAWLIGLESPFFGHGFGQYQYLLPQAFVDYDLAERGFYYSGATLHSHNELAQMWVVGGLFGIVFVVVPALLLVLNSGGFSKHGWLSLVMFFPLALHLMTEFPLYRTVAHWLLIALFVSVVGRTYLHNNDWNVSVKGASVYFSSVGLVVLFLLGLAVAALDGISVGKNILSNAQKLDGIQRVDRYLEEKSDDRELNHWAYGEIQGHRWVRSVFQLAMKEGNGKLVADLLPKMKETMRFINNRKHWSLYAGALAGLGKKAELIGFIDYIEKLDPKYARGMRQAYGL